MSATADRNLLFGILALQLDFVSKDGLLDGMHGWIVQKGRPLGEILVEKGRLKPENRLLLESLVDRHIAEHAGRSEESLAALPSAASLRLDLQAIADNDLQPRGRTQRDPAKARQSGKQSRAIFEGSRDHRQS
jgi:hypothetical protein